MRRRLFPLLLALATAAAIPAALAAQEPGPPPMDRDSLEARVRERMTEMVKRQVGLNDDQMRRLGATNRRFEGQRRELVMREREVRIGLRDEMESGDTTRQAQVSRLLDQMLMLQRQRLDLLEAEQKELATFMTPMQRARYFGIEEQIRRRVLEMREQGMRGQTMRGQGNPPARRPGGGRPGTVRGGVRPPR